MKKLLLLIMVLITISSSVFAGEMHKILKGCKLDTNRWLYLGHTPLLASFFDSQAVISKGPNKFEAVLCNYYYAGNGCNFSICQAKKINKTKHYHFSTEDFDMNAKIILLKSLQIRDMNGKDIVSVALPPEKYIKGDILPKSDEEYMMLRIKSYVGKGNAGTSTNNGSGVLKRVQLNDKSFKAGGVYLGQRFSDVKAIYGEPVSSRPGAGKGTIYSYGRNGTTFDIFASSEVQGIIVKGNNGIATVDGIKVGSSVADVKKVYGEPQRKGNNMFIYEYRTRPVYAKVLIFEINNNIVVGYSIREAMG